MADYATVAELKAHVGVTGATDDTALQNAVSSASAVINRWCGASFDAPFPPAVHMACLIQAARIFSRKSSPYGIAGSPDSGELRLLNSLDVDVQQLLTAYRVLVVE